MPPRTSWEEEGEGEGRGGEGRGGEGRGGEGRGGEGEGLRCSTVVAHLNAHLS